MSVRRWASAGVVGLLGLGMTLHPVTADAAVSTVQMEAFEWANVPAGCAEPVFTGSRPGEVTVPADGVTRTIRLDRTASSTVRTLRATAVVTGRAWGSSWGTTRVRMRITADTSATPRQATPCSVTLAVRTGLVASTVRVPKRSWVVVRGSASARGTVTGAVGVESSSNQLSGVAVKPGQALTRLIAPGTYNVGGRVFTRASVPADSMTPQSSAVGANITVDVVPIGTLRTQRGTALRFVRAGHRNCTDHKVRVRLSSSLPRRAKRVTFYVNGDKRAVLTGRELRRSAIVLRRIAPRSYGVVRAVVLRKSGARNTMQATSWPCR